MDNDFVPEKGRKGTVTEIGDEYIYIDDDFWDEVTAAHAGLSVGDAVTFDTGNPETGSTALNIKKA